MCARRFLLVIAGVCVVYEEMSVDRRQCLPTTVDSTDHLTMECTWKSRINPLAVLVGDCGGGQLVVFKPVCVQKRSMTAAAEVCAASAGSVL